MSSLKALTANPDYDDFMDTMEQFWPGLRTITFPRITKPNVTSSNQQSPVTIPNVNPLSDQLSHFRYGASECSRLPSNASTTSQRGRKRHPASRKRNDCSPSLTIFYVTLVRNNPSSIPPPD